MDSVTIKSCRICLDTKFSESVSFDDSGEWAAMYEFCFDLSVSIYFFNIASKPSSNLLNNRWLII